MNVPGQVVPDRYTRKVCPSCGYAGAELQGDLALQTFACPSCNADLYARPARSYAEMEGLFEDRRSITIDRLSRLLQTTPDSMTPRRARLNRTFLLSLVTVALSAAITTVLIAFVSGRI